MTRSLDSDRSRRFRSPWQNRAFVGAVELLRRILRPFGDAERRLIDSVVAAQNRRVRAHLRGHPPRTVLLIMPRCVKKTGCRAPVQESLAECLACRGCPLGEVAALCESFGIRALVAFRSHIAFSLARSEKPDLIVASACGDRMIKALRSVPEYPALLAPLTGMRQMCVDATVDLPWLARTLADVSRPQPAPGLAARRPEPAASGTAASAR